MAPGVRFSAASLSAAEAAVIVDGAFKVGRSFSILNGDDPKKIGAQSAVADLDLRGGIFD